jgi:hypothetical protein
VVSGKGFLDSLKSPVVLSVTALLICQSDQRFLSLDGRKVLVRLFLKKPGRKGSIASIDKNDISIRSFY